MQDVACRGVPILSRSVSFCSPNVLRWFRHVLSLPPMFSLAQRCFKTVAGSSELVPPKRDPVVQATSADRLQHLDGGINACTICDIRVCMRTQEY